MKRHNIVLKIFLTLGLCAMITACASKDIYWYKVDAKEQEIKRDKFQCEEAAVTYANDMGASGKKEMISKRIKTCMEIRGYAGVPEKSLPPGAPRVK